MKAVEWVRFFTDQRACHGKSVFSVTARWWMSYSTISRVTSGRVRLQRATTAVEEQA